MKVLSLFDGMSCGQIALEKADIRVDKYFASEIKEDGIKVTQINYPNTIQLGDITKLKGEDIGQVDLLMGGSTCQDLSIAMKDRTGLQGVKSKLFFEYVRILKETNPKYFLLENVGRMSKEDKDIITSIIKIPPISIKSELVSGQLRNRLYWTNIPGVELPANTNIKLNDILENGWSDREKARCLLESESRPLTTPIKMFHRYYSTGFTTLIFKDEEHYKQCRQHYNDNFKGMAAKDIDNYSGDLRVYDGLRYLNQLELEKLQTVPKGYTNALTRNQAAGLLGDGWTVDVIAHIFSYLRSEICR